MAHSHQLIENSILAERYKIVRVLGEGGFGITYEGYDIILDFKVAIKEYYPIGVVTRTVSESTEVTAFTKDNEEFFEKGKKSFLKEARTLAKFSENPNVVSVKDFFELNNTVYIVMELLEGTDIKSFLEYNGKMSFEDTFTLLRPIMETLSQIHSEGLIHRDISPDNIMITKDGTTKLLDFGAAREMSAGGEKSLSILLKPGFAPQEQYTKKGNQGPWTDVYALSATMYKMMTLKTPDDAMSRVFEDELESICVTNPIVTEHENAVIMKGMAIKIEERYSQISDLIKACENAIYNPSENYIDSKKSEKNHDLYLNKSKPIIIALFSIISLVLVGTAFFYFFILKRNNDNASKNNTTSQVSSITEYNTDTEETIVVTTEEISEENSLDNNDNNDNTEENIATGNNAVSSDNMKTASENDVEEDAPLYDYNGNLYKFERIKWRILSVDELNNTALVLSDKIIDCKQYNETLFYSDSWAGSTLRNWLNSEFYDTAFNEDEKKAIIETEVKDYTNVYHIEGGISNDNVFLPSIDDISNDDYGFNAVKTYNDKSRISKGTDFAKNNGFESDSYGSGWWWLRSFGSTTAVASMVIYNGFAVEIGNATSEMGGIRPAMYIDLNSTNVISCGEIDSDENITKKNDGYNNPVKLEDEKTVWDCVYFGRYPQSKAEE